MSGNRMAGKVAVVTGAASGIGRAVTLQLLAEGAQVVAADVNTERLAETVELAGSGASISTVVANLAEPDDVAAIVAKAEELGGADVLVNNAGIMDGFIPIGEVDDEQWQRVFAVNVTGPMQLTRALIGPMVERGKGSIVGVGSVAGMCGGAAGAAYTASKHAMTGLTKNTAFFYGPQGVRCNLVAPGGVETNIGEAGGAPTVGWAWERMQAGFGRAQRTATPQEISALVVWLCSDEAVNVNGAVIPTDGGWTAA